MWSGAQHQAFIQLCEMGEVFFGVDWPKSPIKPRLDPLVVGPTGVGKSHLVRSVADILKVPLLRLSYGEWMVTGSRGNQPTLSRIHDFVTSSPKGIIHIDEVDKARVGFQSDWSIYAYAEMFFLLDRNMSQPARNEKWTDELNAKLKHSFWIIGSGTWQMLWDTVGKPSIGFGGVENGSGGLCAEIARLVHQKEIIPKELLKRFCNELILIPPANEIDFELAADVFGIGKLAKELGVDLDYQGAVLSESGARWLEETYGALLLKAYRMGRSDLLHLRPDPSVLDEAFPDDDPWDPVTE
jgi:hypothetical protein